MKSWANIQYLDGDEFSEFQLVKEFGSIDKLLTNGIEKLSEKSEIEAKILIMRFKKNRSILSVALELNFSNDQINRLQRKGIERLANILIYKEKKIHEEKSNYFVNQIPAKNSLKTFGLEKSVKLISEKLLDLNGPSIITITGLGGIGKTALVNETTRNVLSRGYFSEIIWFRSEGKFTIQNETENILKYLGKKLLSAEIQDFEIEKLLKQHFIISPHLIIIDNLNTSSNLEEIITKLYEISGISKFLITSRKQPPTKRSHSFNYRLDEIQINDADKLLAYQADFIGIECYSDEIKNNIDLIYSIVGGNPLALKLLVGLLVALPLTVVLNDFKTAKLQDINEMYHHIYMLAWKALDNHSKKLLVGMMQSTSNGFTLENMRAFSKLLEKDLANSIKMLFDRSLLEERGGVEKRRFGIHRLTQSFLETDIVTWPPK